MEKMQCSQSIMQRKFFKNNCFVFFEVLSVFQLLQEENSCMMIVEKITILDSVITTDAVSDEEDNS